jgi:uncharacterized protein YacL
MTYVERGNVLPENRMVLIFGAVALAAIVIVLDAGIATKSLKAISGLFFGLTAGLLITYVLTMVLDLLVLAYRPDLAASAGQDQPVIAITKFIIGIICCYFCVSFILQTKDDIRFVIPYVEFARQVKGQHPLILDTSVIIDGRIADISETGIIDSPLIVPRFVLKELQAVADSADKLKRVRGRRGLDVLNKMQTSPHVDVQIMDTPQLKNEAEEGVDLKLLALAQELNGRVATNDYNLNKVAKIRNVHIINIHDLAAALKPVVLPGEGMTVRIVKPGEEAGQGVGYLDDGTMVVVDQARMRIGETVEISVTSILQTSAGRMIFGRLDNAPRPRPAAART